MGQVERNGKARDVVGRKPVVRQPDVRLEPEQSLVELIVELFDAALQPGAFNGKAEVLDPHPKEAVIRKPLPAQTRNSGQRSEARAQNGTKAGAGHRPAQGSSKSDPNHESRARRTPALTSEV